MHKVELLSPAGSLECLKAAVRAGADAVYLGGSFYSARAYAKNFSLAEIRQGSDFCHLYGAKAYVAINTLLRNEEFRQAMDYVSKLYDIGIDAVIVQDMALGKAIKDNFPGLQVHASTQTTLHNSNSILQAPQFDRIILAREMTCDEVSSIVKKTGREVEVFIHGSLCMSYSGQCLISSFMGGRSANRGRCAQPCRLTYGEGNPLSARDLCTVEILPKIIETGVKALKIEGRMKNPEYVSFVTSIYRKYIDQFYEGSFKVDKDDIVQLKNAYSRQFTKGFIGGEEKIASNDSSGVSSPARPLPQSIRRVPLVVNVSGGTIKAVHQNASCTISIGQAGRALDQPTAKKLLEKDSEFSITLHGQLYESQAKANQMLVRSISGAVAAKHRRVQKSWKLPDERDAAYSGKPQLIVRVFYPKHVKQAMDMGADLVFMNVFHPGFRESGALPEVPAILPDQSIGKAYELIQGARIVLTGNPAFAGLKNAILDSSFNLFNDYSLGYWDRPAVISPELSFSQMKALKSRDFIVFADGRLVLMRTKEMIEGPLIDRLGRHIPMRLNPAGFMEVLNPVPHGLYNKIRELMDIGVRRFLIDCDGNLNAIKAYRKILDQGEISDRKLRAGHTTGHLFKGVQ
jgi:collagenase-like PrtC family protease